MQPTASERVVSVLAVGPAEDLQSLLPARLRYDVHRADGPASALVRLARNRYDLVIVDHTAGGDVTDEQLAYLRAAKAIRPAAKVIVLVSHTTTLKVIESLRHGVFAYFSRPVEPSAVRDAVAQALSVSEWTNGIDLISAAPDFISVRLRCRLETADRLAQFMKELPCSLPLEERNHLSAAFREMLLNAIEHGGKLDPNEWVRVSRVRTKRTIVYHIQDPGEGFSRSDLKHAAVANPPDEPTAHVEIRSAENMRPGGFGMLIARQLVDEVIYSQKGNEVILIKHLD